MDERLLSDGFLAPHLLRSEQRLLEALPAEEALHHRFSGRFLRAMGKLVRLSYRPTPVNTAIRFGKRAALVLAAALAAALAVTMSVAAWREALFRFVERQFPLYRLIAFEPDAPEGIPAMVPMTPAALPEGFDLVWRDSGSRGTRLLALDLEGRHIRYVQSPAAETALLTDRGPEPERLPVGEAQGRYYAGRQNTLVWSAGGCFYEITSNLDREAILAIAASLRPETDLFRALAPSYLPRGMRLADANYEGPLYLNYADKQGNQLVYRQLREEEEGTLYAASQPQWRPLTFGGRQGEVSVYEDYRTLRWREEGYCFSVTSNVDGKTLIRVAESLKPLENREMARREPAEIPAGYRLRRRSEGRAEYVNQAGERIVYSQDSLERVILRLEGGALEGQPIRRQVGYYHAGEAENLLLWDDQRYVYQLSGPVDRETLVRMAESLRLIK